MGLVNQASQTNDRFVTSEVINFLFPEEGANFGGDFVTRNIQRGRYHGLPSYVAFDDHNFGETKDGMEDIDCWDHMPDSISHENWDLFSTTMPISIVLMYLSEDWLKNQSLEFKSRIWNELL